VGKAPAEFGAVQVAALNPRTTFVTWNITGDAVSTNTTMSSPTGVKGHARPGDWTLEGGGVRRHENGPPDSIVHVERLLREPPGNVDVRRCLLPRRAGAEVKGDVREQVLLTPD
jgi:hypothetical protein